MAFGNYNNNTQKGGDRSPSVYSNYSFANATSSVDKTRLYARFWNKSLVLCIAPRNPDSTDDQPTYDNKNGISIYLNHGKARLFADVLRGFLRDPDGFNNSGVNSGNTIVTISKGEEFNAKGPLIIIRRMGDDGNINSSFAYEVKQNDTIYYTVKGFDEKNPANFDKVFHPTLEIEQLIVLMDEYAASETRAIAYSVIDSLNYEFMRFHTKFNKIGEKLGLDLSFSPNSGGGAGGSSGSFFSRNGNGASSSTDDFGGGTGYTSATLDDFD